MKKILVLLFCVGYPLWSAAQQTAGEKSLSIRAQDGWLIASTYLPAQPGKKTVLLLHDIGKDHTAFNALMQQIADKEMGYLALDLRGHGGSTQYENSKEPVVYTSFAKEGVDNDYNKMTRDVDAAMEYLKSQQIFPQDVIWVGVGLGANVAAKASNLWPEVSGIALLTPVTNFRDVLPIPALRVYKGKVFIAAAADDKKTFLEASVMRNVAFLSSGEGNVTFATAYDKKGHELLNNWVTPELMQWLQTPQRPPLLPDVLEIENEEADEAEELPFLHSSSDETESLVPSVLQ